MASSGDSSRVGSPRQVTPPGPTCQGALDSSAAAVAASARHVRLRRRLHVEGPQRAGRRHQRLPHRRGLRRLEPRPVPGRSGQPLVAPARSPAAGAVRSARRRARGHRLRDRARHRPAARPEPPADPGQERRAPRDRGLRPLPGLRQLQLGHGRGAPDRGGRRAGRAARPGPAHRQDRPAPDRADQRAPARRRLRPARALLPGAGQGPRRGLRLPRGRRAASWSRARPRRSPAGRGRDHGTPASTRPGPSPTSSTSSTRR